MSFGNMKPEDAILPAEDIDYDLKSPCDDCPFLKSSPFHEGVASNLQFCFEAIESHRFAHTCHKTDCRPTCDGPRTFQGRTKHCAGAILMLLKTGHGFDLQIPLLKAAQAAKIDIRDMTARAMGDDRVFTVPEMLDFYAKQLGRRAGRSERRERRRRKKLTRLRK